MKAAVFDAFRETPEIRVVPDPTPSADSVVLEVMATGICRSDWHAWMGHDDTVRLPHVPGHEMAGVIVEVGKDISHFTVGDRVTVPFACGCGVCRYCLQGQLHICDHDFQPGFTHWGSFAQYVEIKFADTNLVRLFDELDFVTAASLGCRFSTAYRAIAQQAGISENDWLAIHGCGGLGLSALMIAKVLGARVIAVDIEATRLAMAEQLGADVTLDASVESAVADRIVETTAGGADASIDALGSQATASNSIACLRKQGRHIQAGLMLGDQAKPRLPMSRVISHELQLVGSHGMSARDYPEMLCLVQNGRLNPGLLVKRQISLTEALPALMEMGEFASVGVTVISDFS